MLTADHSLVVVVVVVIVVLRLIVAEERGSVAQWVRDETFIGSRYFLSVIVASIHSAALFS